MNSSTLLSLTLASPFVAAVLSPLAYRFLGRKGGFVVPLLGSIFPFFFLVQLCALANQKGAPLFVSFNWVDAVFLRLVFVLDGFGGLFALLVSGIGILIVIYAHRYMEQESGTGRFYGFLLFFLGSMLGVCISEHMLTLFLFWELTSISSFLLIGFWFEKEKPRMGALKALVITNIGGLFMLAGFCLLGGKTGVWTFTQLAAVTPTLLDEPWIIGAMICLFIGAFTKSAQSPFHIWLPDAMEAPTPVSAFLHSATMVKAGLILLFRLYPLFSSHDLWFPILSLVGMTTVVVGAVLALKHTDLKAILAYSTVSQLGLFVVMLGYGAVHQALMAGFIFHIFSHAFYKGSLFMSAGIIDHAVHTRDIRKLGLLKKGMPRTFVFFLLACGSLAGLPPFLGFISKEGALEASLQIGLELGIWTWLLPGALTFSATCTVAVAGKLGLGVFLAKPEDPQHLEKHPPHEADWLFLFPPALMAVAGLFFGLAPSLLEKILYPFALIGLPAQPTPHFGLWHGINGPLLLSILVMSGGALMYVYRKPIQIHHEKLKLNFNLNTIYDKKWEWILGFAKSLTQRYQNGSLSQYVGVTLSFFIGAAALILILFPPPAEVLSHFSLRFPLEGWVSLGICIAATAVLCLKDRIARLVSLGGVGILICVYFILRGAPDLALTGFLIEIVMFILVLIVFNQLKEEPVYTQTKSTQRGKAFIAILGGLCMGGIVFLTLCFPLAPSIATYFLENSDVMAGGLNAVNVIVVDFRGFDTFGEITVLCLAGMGVYGLRKVWVGRETAPASTPELTMRPLPASPIMRTVSGWVFPFIVIYSFYMAYRGHNQPGGGFIGGLITAGALILELLAVGSTRFLKSFPFNGRTLFGVGLTTAFITGLAPLFLNFPFLTSTVIRSLHFSTATLFDLGVYLVVVGVTIEIIILMEEGERRSASS